MKLTATTVALLLVEVYILLHLYTQAQLIRHGHGIGWYDMVAPWHIPPHIPSALQGTLTPLQNDLLLRSPLPSSEETLGRLVISFGAIPTILVGNLMFRGSDATGFTINAIRDLSVFVGSFLLLLVICLIPCYLVSKVIQQIFPSNSSRISPSGAAASTSSTEDPDDQTPTQREWLVKYWKAHLPRISQLCWESKNVAKGKVDYHSGSKCIGSIDAFHHAPTIWLTTSASAEYPSARISLKELSRSV